MSAVCAFDTVQSAVDTVTQVMQCGVPMARIGQFFLNTGNEKNFLKQYYKIFSQVLPLCIFFQQIFFRLLMENRKYVVNMKEGFIVMTEFALLVIYLDPSKLLFSIV